MSFRLATAALAIAASSVLSGAHAQSAPEVGRYTMHKVDDGFIRLDTKTGAVSLCKLRDEKWSCDLMADGTRKLLAELEALRAQNRMLEARLRTLQDRDKDDRKGPDDRFSPDREPRGDDDTWRRDDDDRPPQRTFRLPTEKEVDKALDYFETMLKKFQERLKRLEKQAPGGDKPSPPGAQPQQAPAPTQPGKQL